MSNSSNINIINKNNINDIFEILYNKSPLLINSFDKTGKCVLWNKSCEKLFGYSKQELINNPNPLSLFYPNENDLEFVLKTIIHNPDGIFRKFNVFTKNNTYLTCMFANFKLFDDTTLGLGYDVTQLTNLKDELDYNINLLKSILDSQHDCILRVTIDNIIIYCNEKYKNTFNFTNDSCEGFGILKDLVYIDDIEIYNDSVKRSLMYPYYSINTFRMKTILEDYKWFEVQSTGIINENNDILEILYVFKDIQKLKENIHIIHNTFNFSLNGICILEMLFDEEGKPCDCKYVDVNKSFETISGLKKYDIINTNVIDIEIKEFLIDAYLNKIPFQTEYYFNKLNKWYNFSIYKLYKNDFVVDIQDITERKNNELLLQKTLELDSRANNILVHIANNKDLKYILTKICKYCEHYDSDVKASILFFDSGKNRLIQGVGPSLPDDYNYLLEQGLPIGPNVGSCGTCAYTKYLAVTENIQESPNWLPYKDYIEKTKKHNLNSCWSIPIFSSEYVLLGTIANYSSKIGSPNPNSIKILEWCAVIAGVAIEHDLLIRKNKESFDQLKTILNNIPLPIIVTDINKYEVLFLNDANKQQWDINIGDKCYEKLQLNQTKPCDHCVVDQLLDENNNPTKMIRTLAKNTKNKRWYDCYNSAIKWSDEHYVRMEMALDITDLKLSTDLLKVNTEITSLMLQSTDFAATINQTLEKVCRVIDCSRTYIFEFDKYDILSNKQEQSKLYYMFEWCNDGIEPQISKSYFESFSLKGMYWERLFKILNNNEPLNTLVNDLSDENERNFLEKQQIQSILILPIFLKNNYLYGFIGFDECKYERIWSEPEINQLRTLTYNIGIFIDKYNSEDNVIQLCSNQSILLNNLDFYVWYFKDSYSYGFANCLYANTFLKNKTNLIIDNHNKEDSDNIIKFNKLVYEIKTEYIHEDWYTTNTKSKQYLSVRRIPIMKNGIVDNILCIGYDLTQQYTENIKLLHDFNEKLDKDYKEIKQVLTKTTDKLNSLI